MRILFTTLPASGHFHPLAPLARAADEAGHDVAFACPRSFCPQVEANGFRAFPAGCDVDFTDGADPEFREVYAPIGQMTPGPEQARRVLADMFCGFNTRRMIPDLLPLCRDWRPDVIVRDSMEFGGAIVAEHLELPHAGVEAGLLIDLHTDRVAISAQLDRARQSVGLPSDPDLAMPYRYLNLSFTPPRFQDPAVTLPPTLHALRAVPFDRTDEDALPAWVVRLPQRPTVYATLGTEINHTPGIFPGVLQAIIAGLRDEPLNLIVTVGRDKDPEALGPRPPHVHVERYIPQSLLLPHYGLVVTHGGHNTVLAAIDAGLPLVVTPISADQPENAQRCAALGLGRVVDLATLTPEAVREAVRAVLGDPEYRANVRRLRAEMEALPGPEHGVRLLEELVARKAPLRASA